MTTLIQFSNFIHRFFENNILKISICIKKGRYFIWQRTVVIIIITMLIMFLTILIHSIIDFFTHSSTFLLLLIFITISLSIILIFLFFKEFIYEIFPKYRDKIHQNPKKEKLLEKLNSIPEVQKHKHKETNMKTTKQHKLLNDYIQTFFYYDLDESIDSFIGELKELNPFQRLFTLVRMKYGYAMYQWENHIEFCNFYSADTSLPISCQSEEIIKNYNLISKHRKVNFEIEDELISIYRNVFSDLLANGLDLKNDQLVQYSLFLYSFENWKTAILNEFSKLKLIDINSQLKSIKSKIQDLKYKLDYPRVFYIEAMSGKIIPELSNDSFTQIEEYTKWLESISEKDIQNHSRNIQKIQISSKGSQKELIKLLNVFFKLVGVELSEKQKNLLDDFIYRITTINNGHSNQTSSLLNDNCSKIDFIPKKSVDDFVKIFLFLIDEKYIESNKTPTLEILSTNLKEKGKNNGFSLRTLKGIKKDAHDQFSINELKPIIKSTILYNFK